MNFRALPERHREEGKLLHDLEMEVWRCYSEDQGGEHYEDDDRIPYDGLNNTLNHERSL